MNLYFCEKPSQGRDIAAELGVTGKGDGYINVRDGVVTWAIGHLLELQPPDHYGEQWRRWSVAPLPIVPDRFEMSDKQSSRKQLRTVGQLLRKADTVIVATDADREGEMIAREVMDYFGYKGKIKRLWLSALDPESVRKALGKLRDGNATVSLYHAARARSCADWVVGMNLTRAFTCLYRDGREVLNIGRVQTPTFALVVERDREIANFQARDYYAVLANVSAAGSAQPFVLRYDPKDDAERLWNRSDAQALADRALGHSAPLKVVQSKKRSAPPKLFSLSGLQRKANSLWGYSADRTLKIAQSLYEQHKATTYPRSDCVFLPEEQIADVGGIVGNLMRMQEFGGLSIDKPLIRKTVFNTAKVTAHHAIIPTKVRFNANSLKADERNVYLLICKHYLAALMPDYEYLHTSITLPFERIEFVATGSVPVVVGWKAAFGAAGAKDDEDDEDGGSLPPVKDGQVGTVKETQLQSKKTQPPAHYTEGTLIGDMLSVAKYVKDPAKKSRLKETSGIGTEATRANIISKLHTDGFIADKGKKILATPKAHRLYDIIAKHAPRLSDPGETAVWEDMLNDIVDGKFTYDSFMTEIINGVRAQVNELKNAGDATAKPAGEAKSTELPSWHPSHRTEMIEEGDGFWIVPGYGRMFKEIAGREMTLADYQRITESSEGIPLEGFVSKRTGKAFAARLVWNSKAKPYPKFDMKFDDAPVNSKATDSKVKVGRKSVAIQDCGTYYTAEGVRCRLFKEISGRAMTAEDYASILSSKEGVEMSGFVSKRTGKAFSARLIFKPNAKPWPKVEFVFK